MDPRMKKHLQKLQKQKDKDNKRREQLTGYQAKGKKTTNVDIWKNDPKKNV